MAQLHASSASVTSNDNNNGYAYRAIVFALKKPERFDNNLQAKKLLSQRSCIISEHPADPDPNCEWNYLHYHGVVETKALYRFDSDRVFNSFREICTMFKSEQCKLPVNFLAYMQIPPKSIIWRNDRGDSSLPLLEDEVTPQLIEQVRARKLERSKFNTEKSGDVMKIIEMIKQSNSQSESELMNVFHDNSQFTDIYCKRTFTQNFKKALSLVRQSTLDKHYFELALEFKDLKKECLTPIRSANLMERWCKHQGIDARQFCKIVLQWFNRQNRKKNTLYLKGEPNSGKTYVAKSLEKAAKFYAEIVQGISGYTFMYQDAVDTRLIVFNEPYFDVCMIEQLKIVLEGTGTYVHKKNMSDEYLRPTPCLITSNNYIWHMASGSEKAIRARCIAIYDNLRAYDDLAKVKKDLHPRWLNILCMRYAKVAPPSSPIQPATDDSDEEPSLVRPALNDYVESVADREEKQFELELEFGLLSDDDQSLLEPPPAKKKRMDSEYEPKITDAPKRKQCQKAVRPTQLEMPEDKAPRKGVVRKLDLQEEQVDQVGEVKSQP